MRLFVLAVFVVGCAAPGDAPVAELEQAIGEPMSGFPTPTERLGIMAINRARSDPTTLKGAQSQIYPARPPVLWSYELSRSSRFHATNLQLAKATLMHTSPCPLKANVATANCSGDPACACASAVPQACANCANAPAVNNCGTDTFTRIGYFTANTGTGATGEVAAAGYADPMKVVDGWVDEAAGQDGHRRNLLDVGISSNVMGYGHAGSGGCWSSFDVSDSGQAGVQIPKLPTAAVNPPSGAAGSFTFYATWADPGLGAPASLNVVIDGQCTAMARELGTDKLNATYKATVSLNGGCHTYWILGKDAGGGRNTYPTNGALTVSVGGAACNGDWVQQAPAAACEGAMPMPDMATNGGKVDMATRQDGGAVGGKDAAAGGGDLAGMKGGVGDQCQVHADCQSGVCALEGPTGFCTQACDPMQAMACPAGFVCGLIGSDHYCVHAAGAGGGCAIANGARRPSPALAPALLILGAAATRRRRRGGNRPR